MSYGIIDLGSNTFNLLITQRKSSNINNIKKEIPVKLLQGSKHNNINKQAQKRGLLALTQHIKTIKKHNVQHIYAFATSAIRSAKNSRTYIKKIKAETGLILNVINGKQEAELITKGVQNILNLKRKHLLIDIGGGSSEFIIADKSKTYWKESFQVGSGRLLNYFTPSEPILAQEIDNIESFLDANLKTLFKHVKQNKVETIIGCSGSFETLAQLCIKNFKNKINNYDFNLKKLYKIHHNLLSSTLKQRLNMKGLVPMRADMIVISSIFIIFILKKSKINKLKLSNSALKEGVLTTLKNDHLWQESLL